MAEILYIEDDPILCEQVSEELHEANYSVRTAANGIEALQAIRQRRPDLIICDITMPEMDGRQLLSELQSRQAEFGIIPFVFLTSQVGRQDVISGLTSGAIDYLAKPVDFDLLLAKIGTIIRLSRKQRPGLKSTVAIEGILDRVKIEEKLFNAMLGSHKTGASLSVLVIEVDNFTRLCSLLGLNAHDQILEHFGLYLKHALGDAQAIGFLGGAQFAAIIAGDELAARFTARILLQDLSQPLPVCEDSVIIAAKIGAATFPQDGADAGTLLHNATFALSQAKEKSAGLSSFVLEQKQQLQHEAEIERLLPPALMNNQFETWFQPLVSMESGCIAGMEALVRWPRCALGSIPPNVFVPISEKCGQINELSKWVLRTACAQGAKLRGLMGGPFYVAVNVSPIFLKDETFLESVQSALAATGLPPSMLELEITESAIVENDQATIAIFNQLNEMGVRLAVDDFGTGYSSLSQLRNFPFDVLKIDRAFIQNIGTDPKASSLVRGILAMAKSLNLETVSEGIETKEQLKFLRDHGADIAQGFYFSKPLPQNQLIPYLSASSQWEHPPRPTPQLAVS